MCSFSHATRAREDYSFTQEWVDRVGGRALAVIPQIGKTDAKTDYEHINANASFVIRASRAVNGFSLYGSENLPIASTENAIFKTFYPRTGR